MVLVVARFASSRFLRVPRRTLKSLKGRWRMLAAAVEAARGRQHHRPHRRHNLAQATFLPRLHRRLGLPARPRPRTHGATLPAPFTPHQRTRHQARQYRQLGLHLRRRHPDGRHHRMVTHSSTRTQHLLGLLLLPLCRLKERPRRTRRLLQSLHIPAVPRAFEHRSPVLR